MTNSLLKHVSGSIDRLTNGLGHLSCFAIFAMTALQVCTVVYRYVFQEGSIALQESALYAHAIAFMLAMGFCLKHDQHVRVDIFYKQLPTRTKRLINTLGFFLAILPFCITLIIVGIPFVDMAWSIQEKSSEAGGLAHLYILKSLVIIMPITLLISASNQLLKDWLDD